MEFVWSNLIFGFLRNLSLAVGRQELRRYGSVNHIVEDLADASAEDMVSSIRNHRPYECLRDAGIEAVHTHLIAVVGSPTECQLREVAGAEHHAVVFVGHVHQYLRTLARLRIFVGDIVDVDVVIDIFEMLNNGIADRDIELGNAELVHELYGIGVGTVRGAETGHRNANHLLAAHAYHICREAGSQEGQGGIESATDAEHYRLCMRMLPTFG